MSRHIKAMDAYVWVYMKQKTAMVRITKPNTIVLLYPNTGGQQSRQQEGNSVAYCDKGEDAARRCMTNGELVFENRKKRRDDGPGGEVHEPEAPEKQ